MSNSGYKYGRALLEAGDPPAGDLYIRKLIKKPVYRDRAFFLRAYCAIYENRPEIAKARLDSLSDNFPDGKSLIEIGRLIDSRESVSRRSQLIAIPLSMTLPGSGQIYAGHLFDGLQAFGFNAILGSAAYYAWAYQTEKQTSIAIPAILSIGWGFVYITNIWNTAEAVNRYNRYELNRHYLYILSKMESTIDNNPEYFKIEIKYPFN